MHVGNKTMCNNSVKNYTRHLILVSKWPEECPPKNVIQNQIYSSALRCFFNDT